MNEHSFILRRTMPRKRTVSDRDLLDAALVVVRSDGPDALTFGALARESGLAASTIVQRFGSNPGLLRAALSRAWDLLDERTATAVAAAAPDPGGVVELLVRLTGSYEEADFADQLRVLREDLRDEVLRERGRVWLAVLIAAVEQRLAAAPGGPAGLGALVVAHWQGTLTLWGFTRDAPLPDVVRSTLTDLLNRLRLIR
jgi:AcrR family transcriptional regulator